MAKRVLSCIQPTGSTHLGNYFGAVKNWIDLQDKYECFFGIVDLHAMTMPYDPASLKKQTLNSFIELLACGIDPEKCTLFVQSMVPEHSELAWILSCVASYGQLTRMTQFKDKSAQISGGQKDSFISLGLFSYPVLQAADILVYKANAVPVGKDQEQHLELSRNIAVRFNNQFGEYFPEPQALFTETPKVLSLADPTKKMGSSLGPKHFVSLFEEEKSIVKKIKSAVTDSGEIQGPDIEMSPGVANLFALLKACDNMKAHDEFLAEFKKGELKYGYLKLAVADTVVELTNKIKSKKAELEADPDKISKLMLEMSEKARAVTRQTIKEVRELTGIFQPAL